MSPDISIFMNTIKEIEHCTILGTGLIGCSWAQLMTQKGIRVCLWNPNPTSLERAKEKFSPEAMPYLNFEKDLAKSLRKAQFIHECLPEDPKIKKQALTSIDPLMNSHSIVGSSTSGIPFTQITEGLANRERYLVTHPMNPPHLIPVVEMVPTQFTSNESLLKASQFMKALGQKPVLIKKEIPGFVLNRLQCALIAESMALVQEDFISPKDLETIVTHGLGLRWAVLGPFSCMDTNSKNGFQEYVNHYGSIMQEGAMNLKVQQPWKEKTLRQIEEWRRSLWPKEKLDELRNYRDHQLKKLKQIID